MSKDRMSNKKLFLTLIRERNLICAVMRPDKSIVYNYLARGKSQAFTASAELSPGTPAHQEFLEVVGPLSPGEKKVFVDIRPAEEEYTPVLLGAAISNGSYQKAEMMPEGHLKLFMWNEITNKWMEDIYSANSEHAQVILRVTGPLKVGDVFEFQSSKK